LASSFPPTSFGASRPHCTAKGGQRQGNRVPGQLEGLAQARQQDPGSESTHSFGVIAKLCFIGAALTPADSVLEAHLAIEMWAFGTSSVAVVCCTVALFREPGYPNRFGFVLVAFADLSVSYVLFLINDNRKPETSDNDTSS
jgi:hypothetical protein